MGIEKIGKRATAAGEDLSSIPNCSSVPPGWKGEWVQMAGFVVGTGLHHQRDRHTGHLGPALLHGRQPGLRRFGEYRQHGRRLI